jgi:hypothetical protein
MVKDLHGNEWKFRHIFRGKQFFFFLLTLFAVRSMVMAIATPSKYRP